MNCDIPGKGIKNVLVKVDNEHDCIKNIPRAITDEMKYKMKEIVRNEPQQPVGDAIRSVRKVFAENYDEDDDLFDQIIAELGPDKPIEKQLLRVRKEIIGTSPINRNRFDQEYFLRRVFSKEHGIISMDSNLLSPDWREQISTKNTETPFRWEILDNARAHEEEEVTVEDFHDEGDVENEQTYNDEMDEPQFTDLTDKNLPKRILAFTSRRLL